MLIDTSVFVALESGRPVRSDALSGDANAAISVITHAELTAGVFAAADTDIRARRLRTLEGLSDLAVLPVDEAVAVEWARLRVFLAEHGRRLNVNDLWIAATAVATGRQVVTQDADFDALDGATGLTVIRV